MKRQDKGVEVAGNGGSPEQGDDRREFLRIDDQLLLEYRKIGEPPPIVPLSPQGLSEDVISAMIAKPAVDLANLQGQEAYAVLVPWLRKIDWVLELVLRTLARMSPEGIATPTLNDINVSGSGLRFKTTRHFTVYDRLEIELIVPPFAPLRSEADIVRVGPQDSTGHYTIAVKFTTMTHEDKERLIRYVLQKQAARLRQRTMTATEGETA